MSEPLFSVITVCRDAEEHIADAIDSVLAQTWGDWEYVIVDGASSDGTIEVLRAQEPRFGGRLRWVSEPDDGLYDAMNKGLGLARGRFVEFLGADDRLRPEALAIVARVIDDSPDVGIVCGGTHVFGEHSAWDDAARHVVRRGLPARIPASHQATFVRRVAIEAAGGFDPKFSVAADYDLYLRLVEAGAPERLVGEVLADFRLGGASSRSAWRTARQYRDVRVAHGADPLVEDLAALKSGAAATAFAAWARLAHRAPDGRGDSGPIR